MGRSFFLRTLRDRFLLPSSRHDKSPRNWHWAGGKCAGAMPILYRCPWNQRRIGNSSLKISIPYICLLFGIEDSTSDRPLRRHNPLQIDRPSFPGGSPQPRSSNIHPRCQILGKVLSTQKVQVRSSRLARIQNVKPLRFTHPLAQLFRSIAFHRCIQNDRVAFAKNDRASWSFFVGSPHIRSIVQRSSPIALSFPPIEASDRSS